MAYCPDCHATQTDTGGNLVHRATCRGYTVTPITIKEPTTKITADAVDAMAKQLEDAWPKHILEGVPKPAPYPLLDGAATMLRDLWKELEEAKQDRNDMIMARNHAVNRFAKMADELAAANERAIDYRNKWIALGGVMVDALNAETDQ